MFVISTPMQPLSFATLLIGVLNLCMNATVCILDQEQIQIGFTSCLGDYTKPSPTSRRSTATPQCFYLKTAWMTRAM